MNVRQESSIDPLFTPLGFGWVRLWEEYEGTPPTERLPHKVLFVIDCSAGMPASLEAWGDHVEQIAQAGQGLVEAYEIGNEPNVEGYWGWGPPDPGQYVQVLQVAHERIKGVDPGAIVVSAGLAPVGRIQGTCDGWSGNNCGAMDEREYARQMFLLGAGDYLDAFGYHPYGFAYTPETDAHSVSNGFAFRGAEIMHEILEEHDLGDKPIWATEWGWLRDPNHDPSPAWWCHRIPEYEDSFGWMDVSEIQQADYLTRAFRYADENWPWMGAMFVWNLDWHDYNWLCEPSRYFSVRKDDGTSLGTPAMAYDALAAMEKRPGHFGPRLVITPTTMTFQTNDAEYGVFEGTVTPLNAGYGVLTWTATVDPGAELTPTLAITTGFQGTPLTVTVDSTGYRAGTFTGLITVTGTTSDVLDAPQVVTVTLHIEARQPRLSVVPNTLVFLTDVDKPATASSRLYPLNTGGGVLTWTAAVETGMQVTPTLAITTGLQGTPVTITVDSTGYLTGTYSGGITVSTTMTDVLDAPQTVPVTLLVVPEVRHLHLPITLKSAP